MNCEEYQELFPEYLEKTLSTETQQGLTEHLKSCEVCRRELQQTEQLLSASSRLKRHEPGIATRLAVSEAIQESSRPPRSSEFGPVLDINDLSEYLRVDSDVIKIYLEELPHFELGGKLLFRRKSIDLWIEAREQVGRFTIDDSILDKISISSS